MLAKPCGPQTGGFLVSFLEGLVCRYLATVLANKSSASEFSGTGSALMTERRALCEVRRLRVISWMTGCLVE